jgi:hypothetical protein
MKLPRYITNRDNFGTLSREQLERDSTLLQENLVNLTKIDLATLLLWCNRHTVYYDNEMNRLQDETVKEAARRLSILGSQE